MYPTRRRTSVIINLLTFNFRRPAGAAATRFYQNIILSVITTVGKKLKVNKLIKCHILV